MKPEPVPPASVVVVGGGIIGLACALQLRARDIDTLLIDESGQPPPASWGNAGHIAVEQVEPLASLRTLASVPRRLFSRGGALALPARDVAAWFPFALRLVRASMPTRFRQGKAALGALLGRALPAWRRLAMLANARELLAEDGHYVVWESERSARDGREYWASADIGTASIRDLTGAETAELARLMARAPVAGLRFAGTARVRDPGALATQLSAAFLAAGGTRRAARVERISLEGSRAIVTIEDGSREQAAAVVVTAGIGSGRLLRPLGIRVPLIAERGYHIQAEAPAWPDMPPVVFEDRSMIVARFHSGLRATSFVEFANAASPADPRKWDRLRHHAAELGLPFSTRPREWMGARPTLPDYLPAIGRSRAMPHLLYAFGHQHLGLTLAAITGELIADLVCGEAPEVDLAPYALERFQ